MTRDEVKLRIVKYISQTIDTCIPQTTFIDKLQNSTLKLWTEQNIKRLDPILAVFMDAEGNIDIDYISRYYENALLNNGECNINLYDMIPNEYSFLKTLIPNQMLSLKKNDIISIFEEKKIY